MTRLNIKQNKLFIGKFCAEELIVRYGSPLYVYDASIIKKRFSEFKNTINYPQTQIYYACKANTNIEILKLLKKEGSYVETVSMGEVIAAFKAGFKPSEIIFTCSNITYDELKFVIENNILINLDSLTQIRKYGELRPRSGISLRVNQGIGAGHHKHVITGGPESKFGIYFSQLPEAVKLANKYKLQIVGIHQHIGSNILDYKIFLKAAKKLLKTAENFDNLRFVNFGGGFGVPYKPEEKPLDLNALGKEITKMVLNFNKTKNKSLAVKFEAGRYFVAESGILLTTVTDIKKTPFKKFIGVDSGFNHLIRPAMYGSYHEIIDASRVDGPKEIVSIAGNICESSDLFAKDRKLTKFKEGDIVAILNTGAYGYSMSSNYNLRKKPTEILVENQTIRLIRKRENFKF